MSSLYAVFTTGWCIVDHTGFVSECTPAHARSRNDFDRDV